MSYHHVQYGKLHWLLWLAAAVAAGTSWPLRDRPAALITGLGVTLVLALCALSFHYLEVSDQGDHLLIRFGPLPLWRTRIRYHEITGAEAGRTSWLDGWGVHWVPFRGWTYNIWGFDCVVAQTPRRTIRIGTDDPQGLLQFLRTRINPKGESAGSSDY